MTGPRAEPVISTSRVERGLYCLRFIESAAQPSPIVAVRVLQGHAELTSAPGRDDGILDQPGQAMILVVHDTATIEIEVSGRDYGNAEAALRLEPLDTGVDRGPNRQDRNSNREVSRRPGEVRARPFDESMVDDTVLRIGAHISRRGDLEVGAWEWIAGPDMLLPIEGLTLETGRGNVWVALRTQSVQSGGRWSRWHSDGQFAGSRQKADPLIAIGLRLEGDQAADYVIDAEVMALGSQPQKKTGESIEFVNFDAIVGFRLRLSHATHGKVDQLEEPRRVRIFRARPSDPKSR